MRVVILGSGRGTNAEALLKAWRVKSLGKAEIVAIYSDKQEARILELGKIYGVTAQYLDPGEFKTKLTGEAERSYIRKIRSNQPDLIVLAGFMRVIKTPFLEAFAGKIINLHPSLLPAFKGLNGIKQAFDYGVKITGCTVHYVSADVDGGKIIDQRAVGIEPDDTLESLESKIHRTEHKLLIDVVKKLSQK